MHIVISCACDDQIALRLHRFLLDSQLSTLAIITRDNDEITIHVDQLAIEAKQVQRILEGFLSSNSDTTKYSVTKFGGIFTVGIKREIDELLIRCQMCGFLAHHGDELLIHKSLHAAYMPP